MTPQTTRVWLWLHKWSSLICTVFMLLLCLTGLPLIFHHELGHWLGTEMQAPPLPAGVAARAVTLDEAVAVAQRVHPDRVAQYASPEEDSDDLWRVTMAPTPAPTDDFRLVVVDARTGDYLGTPPLHSGFLWIMFKLHVDLFAGLAGKLFLGLMGALLLVSLISGTVLYAPFMRKLAFGTVRRGSDRPASRQEDDRARKQRAAQRRLKWLDLHNLLGIVLLAWLFVVAAPASSTPGPTCSSNTGSTTSSRPTWPPTKASPRCRLASGRPFTRPCTPHKRPCLIRAFISWPFRARPSPARTTTSFSCAATRR